MFAFFPQLFYIMSQKNEIAPFSLCPTWFLKIVPTSGHYPQQKNSPAFLFTQKSVKMRLSRPGGAQQLQFLGVGLPGHIQSTDSESGLILVLVLYCIA